MKIAVPFAALALAACGHHAEAPRTARAALPADWRTMATPADRVRLRGWRDAWMRALQRVRVSPEAGQLGSQGALFEPDRALPDALPPAGDYRCRVFKLGAKRADAAEFTAYPAFACRIDDEGDVRSFYKRTGSQRPVGLILRDGAARATFLGTMMLGDEATPLRYGQDRTRDMAGFVERIGEGRWRLVLPWPAFESILDVVELVPAGAAATPAAQIP